MPFYFAAQSHDDKSIGAFLKHGVKPDIFTLLQLNRVDEVIRELRENPSILKELPHPEDVIYDAIAVGATEVVRIVLESGISPNAHHFDQSGPPLIQAISKRRIEIIRLLLDSGADIAARDHAGYGVLQRGADFRAGDDIITLLKERGGK